MFNDKTTTCLLESCSSHFILLHEAVKASKNTALYNFTRSTAGVEHPQYGCICTATIKGYYILFKDCAAYHGPGWEFEGWGQSGFDLAKLVCNGSIVLLHYFTDPCSYLHWSITNTHDLIHKCDTPQSIHVLIFFQLKAFTFLWHTGKNSLLTANLPDTLIHYHWRSQAVVTVWSSECSRIHS